MKHTKKKILSSVLALTLCLSMLLGSTFAWFTDSVTSGGNKIQSGNLEVDLLHKVESDWVSLKEHTDHKIFDYDKWEPGYTRVESLKVANLGSLALKYKLSLEAAVGTAVLGKNGEKLSDVIDVYVSYSDSTAASFETIKSSWKHKGTLTQVMANPASFIEGELLPAGEVSSTVDAGYKIVSIALHMQESAGNEYQKLSVGDIYVNLIATQSSYENDSFGNDYDIGSTFPKLNIPVKITVDVEADANGLLTSAANMESDAAIAHAPAGVKVDGDELTFTLNELDNTQTTIKLGENEEMRSLDVHVEGVADDNTVPLIITIPKAMMKGLNATSRKLIHVENGQDVVMNPVPTAADVKNHNDYYYDPATGDVVMALASFSEVATVQNTENPWTGGRDYSWYTADASNLTIANADQLAGLSAIVGGMDNQTQDSFNGKIVKLVCDIDIGDLDSENGYVFYPIGYWNSEGTYEKNTAEATEALSSGFYAFQGTFDGNGHTIANFYQNTWEMKGDHNWYDPIKEQYYRDGMGLFGKVYGGTVKNLTVKNFSSDGEITTTGTIAAYADCGATFENIAIFDCNPRVYNIGNGGIVGCVGWYANDAHTTPVTFKNITVDNTNKISALWGSWDVACGGIVGQYYPTSGQESAIDNGGIYMENCHVAAQIDVYNDVCANYQYYAYRYAGILIGSVRENVTQNGHVYPNMDGITFAGCTVHYGDWNDYYYCEIVANSLASYTHDHQMSRLTQVAKIEGTTITYLNGTTGTVPTSGWAHYVVVNGEHSDENATCYHFVDGKVWNHADAGTEVVDGQTVLKEDKQHIYREFNNLVTGYGWGVTSKAVGEVDGVAILDRQEGDSEVKFEAQDTISETYRANNERAIGKLFKAATLSDPKLVIHSDTVVVTVSPKPGTTSTAGGIFTPNTDDWTKGTIMFTGKGEALITITDYYYCISTTVEVEIVENKVTGLSVKTNKNLYDISPDKMEKFSVSDITVTAVYSDGNARELSSSEFTYAFKENAGDFTTFGEKTGVVSYTYAEDTVTAEFKVVAVNVTQLELSGAGGTYELYFEQFGINAVPQQFYMAPGKNTNNGDVIDLNSFGASTLNFATGTVAYTAGYNGGPTENTANHGGITINCTTAPFADIFGYVGYADRVPVAFGVYVDDIANLEYTLPMDGNADINNLTGTTNSKIFYIQAPLNTMSLSAGTHTVTFVSVFEDGIQTLTEWTVNIAEKEEVDISQKTANVIILAGQSNAYGASALTDAVKGLAASADYSNIFINYSNINCENGVWKSLYYNSGFDKFAPGVGGTVNGACFGPEVGLAYQLATNSATKDEVWYIIKYATAGSILDGQWLKGTYDNEGLVSDMGGYLSDLMIDYVYDSLAKIEAIHGDNINIHSFVWMQGESDALYQDSANEYKANEATLVNMVRDEFAGYAKEGNGENIVFVSGGIAKYADIDITLTGEKASNGWVYSDAVNNGKQDNAKIEWNPAETGGYLNVDTSYVLSNSAWIDTSSLLVGANAGENNDVYHYSSVSMWNLGKWFGTAVNYVASLIQ